MRWAMLRKSIVGRLGEEAQQAESNSIKLAEVVTAMRKAHLKEACADGFALRRTKRGAEAEAAEAAEAAGKLRRCKEDGAAAAEVRHTGSPSHRAPLRPERSGQLFAQARGAVLATAMQEMRTACKDRLLSWERGEAAAHQALLVASAHDASAVGEEEDAAEEEAKARAARSELGQLCSRCRTYSAALRLQCAEATLACAGAALAGDDCVEEIRRAPTLSICALRLFV